MKMLTVLLLMTAALSGAAQTAQQDVHPSQLKALLDLPLEQAIQKRNLYKEPSEGRIRQTVCPRH